MPYREVADLPAPVRNHLPAGAQSIYLGAFNHAWQTYKRSLRREEIAHRTAWAAVKRRYEKAGDKWRPKGRRSAR